MLRWLSLTLVLTTSVAVFADPSLESKEPSDALPKCQAHAWVRAPDMVPGDVIAGDVKVKLRGPCPDAESYVLGLRYKERVFWKLRREDAPIPKRPKIKYNSTGLNRDLFHVGMPFQDTKDADYNKTEWMTYQKSVQNKDLWSVHEDERIAFEIKTPLVSTEGAEPLPAIFTTRFGILVPNTNYPPGLDYRRGARLGFNRGTNTISSESVYEYFVEIKFSNGTVSEIPAGITAFAPVYHPTDNDAPHVSVSPEYRGPISDLGPSVDMLRSNYTIEIHFPDGAHVYQNSTVNITATVHRIGYTNRTDIPMRLCASLQQPNDIEWHPQELKNRSQTNRSQPFTRIPFIRALVPFMQNSHFSIHAVPSFTCQEIDFAAASTNSAHEGHISSTSSEPLSLSIHAGCDTVPDFSTYYQKLEHRVSLNLHIKPDPSEPWENELEKVQWEKQIADMDDTDFDWVPWTPLTHSRRRFLSGDAYISVIPMQKQGPVRSTPVHYLSDNARQPLFVNSSDITGLRLMLPEERDVIAPLAQPSIKVFPKGEELLHRYFIGTDMQRPIYVGDTWAKKVLPMVAEGQRERDTMDRLLVVQ
ncbi:hypothetical protein DEU56DRAFT_901841 [Suillus clintonianus]|uniref:uncharacterized protein n=1 Tax=Suillus clintonianus TaxID=1904413 RepID=UPI001B873CD4|nr:uncharacterized protein DEU56DRAFT_901841 [Suillus clintonianus]KAG2135329.1 hypothetical protein DEU56DRAFT_901841 [Suillus clintonianus]